MSSSKPWYEKDKGLQNIYENSSKLPLDIDTIEKLNIWCERIELFIDEIKTKNTLEAFFKYLKINHPELLEYGVKRLKPLINTIDLEKQKDPLDIIKETINTINKETDSILIDQCLMRIPDSNILVKKDFFDVIAKKSKYGIRALTTRYKELQEITFSKIIELELREEDIQAYASDNNFNIGKIKEIIKLNYGYIIDTFNGLFYYDKYGKFHEILLSQIDLKFKTKDINLGNVERYSFKFGDLFYRNLTFKQSLTTLNSKTLKITDLGRDILKKYFNHQSSKETFKKRTPKYIMGWDNGWILPIIEKKKSITIISHTVIQELIYQKAKNFIKEYSKIEKEEIKEKLKEFIKTTQTNPLKHTIIIGWSVSSPFKLYFINKFQLFVLDYLCGLRETGKTHLGLFYVVYFYNLLESYLSESVLNNKSQLEDYMASSTFPLLFSEFTKIYSSIVDIIKESCTGTSNMIRKTIDQSVKVNKPKTTAIMLDSNKPLEKIDNAMNTKMNFQNFDVQDKINYDEKWVDLFNELKKKTLFSLVYDYTKNWTNKEIDKIITHIKEEFNEEYNQAINEDSRLAKTYLSIMFGIVVFENVFDIRLKKEGLVDLLIQGRTYISSELLDSFLNYCTECIHYAEEKEMYRLALEISQEEERPYPVPNPLVNFPSYIKYGLTLNKDNKYIFTTTHIRGFNSSNRFYNFRLKELCNLLKDSLEDKSLLKYDDKSKYSIDTKATGKAIIIDPNFMPKSEPKKTTKPQITKEVLVNNGQTNLNLFNPSQKEIEESKYYEKIDHSDPDRYI